jgi:hypothetical protein
MVNKIKFCAICLCLILLASCAAESPNLNADSLIANTSPTQESIGTSGQLIAIESDNVSSAGYEASSMVMTVKFDNGALYEYYGVPADLWNAFIAAQPHPWSQVGYPRLVQSGVPYKRIG